MSGTAYVTALDLVSRDGVRELHLTVTQQWPDGHAADLEPSVRDLPHDMRLALEKWLGASA